MKLHKNTKKLVKDVFAKLDELPTSFETLKVITLNYFSANVFAEYKENHKLKTLTYQQLFDLSNDIRNNLLLKHSKKSGAIILQMSNSYKWYIAFWGIISAGFKPILVNPTIKYELNEILKNIDVICTITDNNVDILLEKSNNQPIVPFATELAFLSSGTTDVPKVITYDIIALKVQIKIASEILKKNKAIRLGNKLKNANKIKVLAFLPLYHIFGFIVIVVWFSFFGRTIVFLEDISAKTIQSTCREQQVTHFFAVPLVWENTVNSIYTEAKKLQQYNKLCRAIKMSNCLQNLFPNWGVKIARNLLFKKIREKVFGTQLQFLISGGATINKDYLKTLNGLGYSIHNGYGLTESGIVSVELSKYVKYRNHTTVGKPFKVIQWQINSKNELQLKSELLYKSKMIHGELTINKVNEWYDTSDLAKKIKGRLQILGRLDDAIISADGEKVSPEELENLFNISDAYTVAILGIKQRSGSHQINLLIWFKTELDTSDKDEIIKRIYKITDTISLYKRPVKFFAVDQLPLTDLGKIKHKQLISLYEQHQLMLVPLTKNIDYDLQLIKDEQTQKFLLQTRLCFAKVFQTDINNIHDNTNFINDLGGSSLDYYAILNEIFLITNKEIKLTSDKVLLTPLDFALYLKNN
ncbi:MAG: AMP-binding protein [Mycoplasmataceae bacterium]|nr:AMP-binding protein [Mycoplasmataceae bacterium]